MSCGGINLIQSKRQRLNFWSFKILEKFDKIKTKYLKPKELSKVSLDEVIEDKEIEEEDLLDKIELNGIQYYYEAKDKGIIYDLNSNPSGVYKNGKFILN